MSIDITFNQISDVAQGRSVRMQWQDVMCGQAMGFATTALI